MRVALSLFVFFITVVHSPAQDPPPPKPVLPAAPADAAALRAAIRIPLDPPEYHFRFDDSGRFEVFDRSIEANERIVEISKTLKQDASDAERLDELRLWHHRRGDLYGVRDCGARAARWYRERLKTDPYNAGLLTGCGEALIEAGEFADGEKRLRKAAAVDPNSWRAWFLLARLQIDSAYAMQSSPAPFLEDDSERPGRPMLPPPRPLPAALHVDLPPDPEVAPMPQPVRPVGLRLPTTIASNAELRQLATEAGHCLDEALALAPHEPTVLFARCCQRKLAAESAEEPAGPFDPFDVEDNLADIHAAITDETSNPDLIGVATWFEIMAAQKRLDRNDDSKFRRQMYALVCERIERLEAIAAKADGPTAARAALLAAHLCRKIEQQFRAGVQLRFAVKADPESRPACEAYLASLAESGTPAEYLAAARKAADRFDGPLFHLRLADALARSDDTDGALRVIAKIRRRAPDYVPAALAEAALRLHAGGGLPQVNAALDAVEVALATHPNPAVQADCALLRACGQIIGGNATLGRMLLDDLGRQEPNHPRVKAAREAVE
jgi:tetratricopeptide (TPR) repeat protein